jgi:hypothetical protein
MAPVLHIAAALLALLPLALSAQVHRCVDTSGRVVYQERACAADGTEAPAQAVTVPAAKPKAATPTPTTVKAPVRTEEAPGPYQRPGLGLAVGMGTRDVVEQWGLPTDVRNDRNWTFMHWCDMRVVLLIDAELKQWDAPFADSIKGASLYRYGSPWIAAAQR